MNLNSKAPTFCKRRNKYKTGHIQETLQWRIFWDYMLPRDTMETSFKREMPKDTFQKDIYLECKQEFYLTRFTSIFAK